MGQYYMPVIKNGRKINKVYSHDFNNGLKLTEHSYIGNNFVNVVANYLVENPSKLYWCGDYAEEDDFNTKKEFETVYNFAWNSEGERTTLKNTNTEFDWSKDWYFVNNTKKEYLLMPKYEEDKWTYSPISLLTAIGNGRGGGDYEKEDMLSVVGYWAGDIVYLSTQKPECYYDITEDADFGKDN